MNREVPRSFRNAEFFAGRSKAFYVSVGKPIAVRLPRGRSQQIRHTLPRGDQGTRPRRPGVICPSRNGAAHRFLASKKHEPRSGHRVLARCCARCHNDSRLLVALLAVWVLAPFSAFVVAVCCVQRRVETKKGSEEKSFNSSIDAHVEAISVCNGVGSVKRHGNPCELGAESRAPSLGQNLNCLLRNR
jgi:hypothetical protein